MLPASLAAAGQASDVKIRRVRLFRVIAPRWKIVGKNSRKGVHGNKAYDSVLRIETTDGREGFGSAPVAKDQAALLIGKDPLDYFHPGVGIVSPLGRRDAPLWDLVGKLLQQPVWRLFGGYGPESVPIYDGSIYFSDLEPEFADRKIARILEEIDHGLEFGHRAFKIKVGRGAKWMPKAEGFRRDVEVVQAIHKHVQGVTPAVKLMVDANNGYDLATTKRFLDAAGIEFYFVEEMFPETVEEDLELKAWIRDKGWNTRVADGESAKDVEHFEPYLDRGALDVLQADMRRFGFTNLLRLARQSAPTGATLAPHNWGSYLGGFMQAVLGRGIPNFCIAELDPGQTDVFDASAFKIHDGQVKVPDTPGCGLELREAKFADLELKWDVTA